MASPRFAGTAPATGGMCDVRLHCDETPLRRELAACNNKEVGNYGEYLAAFYVQECGMEIRERNWRCPFGEADLIADDDGVTVLIEVKTRVVRGERSGLAPEVAVNHRKRTRYEKLALSYVAQHARCDVVRFDVVAVLLLSEHDACLRHLPGAYEWEN